MKKNLYLVQADILRKTPMFRTTYLPYTSGALWAYAKQSPVIDAAYALREILFLRDPVTQTAQRLKKPFLVGFACTFWNMEYNKALAQEIKRLHPECHILFGGHNVAAGGRLLEELPIVDYLIHGEGEIPFQALLAELAKETPALSAVPGFSYRNGDGTATNPEYAPESLDGFPSPFLAGVFDPILAAHPDIQWSTAWETNRGCPHHCAYCDWACSGKKIRTFPMERLTAEIEWICTNKIDYVFCADANFGILPRDEEILGALAEARGRTGFPVVFACATTKNISERVFRIAETLNRSGLVKHGPTLSVQSLSLDVLRNIGRQNLDDEALARWLRRCLAAGFTIYTDLIVGLPGETLQSFCAGVEKLFALGQHGGVVHYPCYLLVNAPMAAPEYRERHGIRTRRKIYKQVMEDIPLAEQIDEFVDVVDETAAMPHADWLTANYFMLLAMGAHGYGPLRLVAMLLHTERICPYADFYLRLLDFCRQHPESLPVEAMMRVIRNFTDSAHGLEPEPLQIPGFSFGRMWEDQYFFCRAVLEPDRFYAGTETFLRQFDWEPGLLAQLLRYQRESIILPGAEDKTLAFAYDFPAYFSAIYAGNPIPLERKNVTLRFTSAEGPLKDAQYFFHIVQKGRFSNQAFYTVKYAVSPPGAAT